MSEPAWAYLALSVALAAAWSVLYVLRADLRPSMLRVSLGTTPLGLTEPLFVPEYWNPPTLWDFARRTGFDLESLLFSFAIGGIVFTAYDVLAGAAPSAEESRAINDVKGPVLIISASGMATGGRVLHHPKQRLPDRCTTVLLVGYQATGTQGRRLQNGEETLRIFGEDTPVRARVETIHGLSAHADADGLLRWVRTAARIRKDLGWQAHVPEYRDQVALDGAGRA